MKDKKKLNPFLRIFTFLSALILLAVAAAVGLYYYFFSIPEPEGLSLAGWPSQFTSDFSTWMANTGGTLRIEDIGLKRLDEYGLWLQVIDESGQEVFSHNKPADGPVSYSASELMALGTSPYQSGNTVFVSSFEDSGKVWSYLIGFPYAVGKYMLYYNGETAGRLSSVFRMAIFVGFCFAAAVFLLCVFWLIRQMGKITDGIGRIACRSFQPLPEKGIFSGVYAALNSMDTEIQRSDQLKAETDQARREWIANITHDLKTPLSPVKGYAELLADGTEAERETIQEYGSIILKNVDHAEKLINDLKLTYQLESGALPFHPQQVPLIRYLKELVIDVANDPAFSGRDIAFYSRLPEINTNIDPDLFRRAMGNLIVNALAHNPPDTKVSVSVAAAENGICISVCDDGAGLSDTERSSLFTRYYRGTNTKEKPEGSGLGLAIAKQIILLHGGDITVQSKPGEGTEFMVLLPAN